MKNKRKVKEKKVKFAGWGSKSLIEFLQSIGKDTDKQLSQYDVAAIIDRYVHTLNLLHPVIKNRVVCDEKLRSLFGKRWIPRMKIHDLLNSHFAETNDSSEHDYSSEEYDEDVKLTCKKQKVSGLEKRVPYHKKKVSETLLSCFAAIIPENLKLLYLKRSLVQVLVKHRESFEHKLLGSYIRIKSDDANDFSRKSYQLHPVTGVIYVLGNGDVRDNVLLRAPNIKEDIPISLLSDDDFSKEECEDLCQRVKDGLLNRPTVVEVEKKAQILHEDITKHWLPRELASLQNLIDQANKKRRHKELFEYIERMKVLQTPSKQSNLLTNVPKVVADILEEQVEGIKPSNSSAISVYSDVSHPTFDLGTDQASTSHDSDSLGSSSKELTLTTSDDISSDTDFVPPSSDTEFVPPRAYIKKRNKMVAKRKLNKPIGKKIVIQKSKTEAEKTIRKRKNFHQVPWIRTRSSPRTLSNAIRSLNDAQRQSVIDMGFKGILNLSFEEIPSKMGYWLVDNFDERTCTIRMEHASLEITKKCIHQMLGVPMGGLQINTTSSSKKFQISKTSQVIKEWKTQFGKEGQIRPADIVEHIQTVKDAGKIFKLNFLVLFATSMAESKINGSCNNYFLPCIEKDEDIKNLDWCGYILDCLKTSKARWNREDNTTYYTGPLTLLTLFYVDSTSCQSMKVCRRRPAIKGWTSELLKKRELAELKLGGFGKGAIELPLDVDENEDDGTIKLGDTTEADTAKDKETDKWELNIKEEMIEYMNEDENHAAWCEERQGELNNEEKTNEDENSSAEVNDLQGFIGEIESKIKKISDTKVELDEILIQAVCRFPDSAELHKLKSQGEALFRQSSEHQETATNAKDVIDDFFKNAY